MPCFFFGVIGVRLLDRGDGIPGVRTRGRFACVERKGRERREKMGWW